ncbi:hypothetical protein ACA607_16345 [Lactiplantibacillus plantarum]|uniref:hypothetical protein n=1 Tax=Lactiplantibacillus plantarum TaxID=1590 RepID=UPI003C202774
MRINLHFRLYLLKNALVGVGNTYFIWFDYQLLMITMPKHRFTTRAVMVARTIHHQLDCLKPSVI